MKFVCYHQWKQLPDSANALFAQGEQDSVFISRIWLENLTSHALAEPHSLVLACVVDDTWDDNQRVLGILPLMQCPRGSLSSLSNNFTSAFSLLITKSDQQDSILNCLATGLLRLPVQPIQFEPIASNDNIMLRLHQSMQALGFQGYTYFRFYNWMHRLNGQSFDEYMSERPASLRNTIRRKQRKLEREHNFQIKLYKNAGIDQALADYDQAYKSSWKANELFADFTPNLVKSLSQLGWLRLAILYINEQAAAAQIWIVVHGKANIYRLVYDENWKNYSPGSILTEYVMRYVIDTDKVSEIDFLTGNERYKQDWMTVRREYFGIRFAKPKEQNNKLSQIINPLKNLVLRRQQRVI